MPKKRKPGRFSAVKEVKAMARERIGIPPTEKVVPDKKKNKGARKHKSTLARMLSGDDPPF
ncbi:MAG: hypothetical protein ACHP8A_08305 [Terriglobales bacterium]